MSVIPAWERYGKEWKDVALIGGEVEGIESGG